MEKSESRSTSSRAGMKAEQQRRVVDSQRSFWLTHKEIEHALRIVGRTNNLFYTGRPLARRCSRT
jgi:hypothetical protein